MDEAIQIAQGPIDGAVPGATYRVPPPGFVEVLAVLDEGHRDDIAAVADGLRAAGLVEVIPRRKLGVVHGEVAEGGVAALEAVDGVAAVRLVGAA